jgi:hypothetical protein
LYFDNSLSDKYNSNKDKLVCSAADANARTSADSGSLFSNNFDGD